MYVIYGVQGGVFGRVLPKALSAILPTYKFVNFGKTGYTLDGVHVYFGLYACRGKKPGIKVCLTIVVKGNYKQIEII